MLRTRTLQTAARASTAMRTPPLLVRAMSSHPSAGDTGAVRPGGEAASDSFQRREQALENMYIHQRELDNLKRLQEKLTKQRAYLEELDAHVGEMVERKTQAAEASAKK